ncbi:MAG: antA/AntB antirepressor family protein [Odoribacter splanchnicus]|jgi:phage related anti-repressor protein
MEELIKITEYNGKKAVSARELYEKLGFASQHWASWYKKNITSNPFAVQNEDFVQLPLSGRTQDFALSIDFAKRLSMMARTKTGEQIRNYFIEVEKRVNRPLSQAELLLQQCQMLVEQEKRLSQVEEKVDRLIGVHEEAERDLHELPISDEEIPEMSLRDQIRMLVNKYCKVSSLGQHQVWDKVYTTLYYSYHIPLRSYKMRKGESLLDVAERVGCLDKIHVIVSGLFKRLNFIEF